MFATILRILTAMRLGASAKRAVARGLQQAALVLLACVLVLAGAVFALIAAYLGLRIMFEPIEAAGIMAGALAVPGFAILLLRPLLSRRSSPDQSQVPGASSQSTAATIQQGAEEVTRTLGPVNVITLAVILGIAAGRTFSRS
jgi:hypothetical protein